MARLARLFVAVWPPAEVVDALAGLARPSVAGVRWTGRGQWHVTLRFLGRVDDVAAVAEALGEAFGGVGAVEEARLGPAVGRIGSRVLQVPVAGLGGLADRVAEATAGLGQAPEARGFAGHVTLARVAKSARVDLASLAGEAVSGSWTVGEVSLVESFLESAGARYAVVGSFPVS